MEIIKWGVLLYEAANHFLLQAAIEIGSADGFRGALGAGAGGESEGEVVSGVEAAWLGAGVDGGGGGGGTI
jgi:hypothetical protein